MRPSQRTVKVEIDIGPLLGGRELASVSDEDEALQRYLRGAVGRREFMVDGRRYFVGRVIVPYTEVR